MRVKRVVRFIVGDNVKYNFIIVIAFLFSGCATNATEKSMSDHYETQAKNNESWANEYYKSGNERAEKYHREQATVDKHNQIASSCDFFDLIFSILINSDGCNTK